MFLAWWILGTDEADTRIIDKSRESGYTIKMLKCIFFKLICPGYYDGYSY